MAVQEKIGGRVFAFGTLSASQAVSVQVAIAKVIGEPLFKALAGGDFKGQDKEKLLEIGGAAIALMASRMDAEELLKTMETVFACVMVDGQRVNMDSDASHGGFTGKPKEMWQVFIKALQVNFADFFDGLRFDLPRVTASKSSQ